MFDRQRNENVVVKISDKYYADRGMTKPRGLKKSGPVGENILDEVTLIQKIQHFVEERKLPGGNFVCRLLNFYNTGSQYWTVLENCDGGEFFTWFADGGKRMPENLAKTYFHQIALGIHAIHSAGVSHLDLSLENILLKGIPDSEVRKNGGLKHLVKVCDFGVAKTMPSPGYLFTGDRTKRPGKFGYMAPEIFEGKNYDGCVADIWSLGVILLVLLSRSNVFSEPSLHDPAFKHVMKKDGVASLLRGWKIKIDQSGVDLLSSMLCPANTRITIDEVLGHKWLASSD